MSIMRGVKAWPLAGALTLLAAGTLASGCNDGRASAATAGLGGPTGAAIAAVEDQPPPDAGDAATTAPAGGACAQPSPAATWTPVGIAAAHTSLDVNDIWASQAGDVWLTGSASHLTGPSAVGNDDQVQRWDGSRWVTSFDGFPGHVFTGVFGFAPNDVWATGDRALHWNGAEWADQSPPPAMRGTAPLDTIWGLAPNDVWTSADGHFFHWNGTGWTEARVTPADATNLEVGGFWGASPNDVWALGAFPAAHPFLAILHWNGVEWTQVLNPQLTQYTTEEAQVNALWGSAANDIWAVGFSYSGSQIWHYDGRAWKHATVPMFNGMLTAVWGFCASDVWAVGEEQAPGRLRGNQQAAVVLHFDGQSWSRVDVGTGVPSLSAVGGTGSDDLWVGGRAATMLHRHR
jgi:hypothetical protein